MGQVDTATITGILPKLIEDGSRIRPVADSRFLREINKAKQTNMINPGGLYTPYAVSENYGGFAVPEGGPIRAGSKPAYTMAQAQIRQLWKSMNWTGALERIRDQYLTKLQQDPKYAGLTRADLMQKAMNRAVADQMFSTFKEYARMENFFALQGGDNSAVGVVTAINHGTKVITCDGLTTAMGNRFMNLGMEVEFRDNAGVLRDATDDYYTIDQVVTHNSTGNFHVSVDPTDVAAGDTVHLVNGYAALPTGVPNYVDDAGEFKGITRSDYPEIFESVMIRHNNAPSIAPIHVREQLSFVQGKVGYERVVNFMLWMNKAQKFNWETFVYDNLIRQVGADRVRLADYAVAEFEWDGHPLNIDVDVPPDSLYVLNMLTWRKITQTALQAYVYHTNQILVNPPNAAGQYLDAKQATIFSEYNWDTDDVQSQSIQSGFGFNYNHI